MLPWFYLFLAGIFEISLALGLKYSNGFTKFWPTAITISSSLISFASLSQSVKVLSISLAYAVWTGIGAIGITIVGVVFLQESLSLIKILCILLITAGIVGLKFS